MLTSLLQEPLHPVATHVPLASRRNLRHWSGTLLLTPELYLVAEDVNVHHSCHHYHQNSKPPSIIFRQKCKFSHICHLKSQLSFCFFGVCVYVDFSQPRVCLLQPQVNTRKGKKTTFHEKREIPKCCWFCLINSDCSSSVSVFYPKKQEYYLLFFFFFFL